ncbi:MAG: putative glycosyltransferase, partial [Pseudonocardiales bacterium]|nr:putative glycosyltransferase [Pseudonocardiales bacterium]
AGLGDSAADRDPRSLWCNTVDWIQPPDLPAQSGRVRFTGHVSATELDQLYRSALCVVAPAYLEDYGLTAIEAMAYGKPLIVCRDGGNLANFVTDHENGFVVEPSGEAIAKAVQTLADDRALAARMGAVAREVAREYTWENSMKELSAGVDEVMAS